MESSQRGALGLVRLVAFCLIVIGILDGGMYLTQYLAPNFVPGHQTQHQQLAPLKIWRLALDALPVIAGIIILIKAKAIAEWLADMIE